MTRRQHPHGTPTPRRLVRTLAVAALAATTMASDCAEQSPVDAVTERTVVARLDPAGRSDTTYVADTLLYVGPVVYGADGRKLGGFEVRWESSRPEVARLLDAPTRSYFGAGPNGEVPSPPEMRVEVARDGEATVTMTPVGVNFANGQTLRYAATIVARANRPTTLDVQSVYNLRVGDSLTLAASPRGSSPGVFTTGKVDWDVTNDAVAELLPMRGPDGLVTDPQVNPLSSGPTQRVTLRGRAVGTTPLRVTYTGRDGVRLERTVTVNVTANAARVSLERAVTVDVYRTNEPIVFFASVLDAAGQRIDPSAVRFAVRDSVTFRLQPTPGGCPDTSNRTVCGVEAVANDAEVIRRGGVVRTWVVASAGAAAADSLRLTVYPAIAAIALSPSTATLALGGSVDVTVVPRDAAGNAIPAAAFPSGFPVLVAPGTPAGVSLQLSTTGKPPMVTNVALTALPTGPNLVAAQVYAATERGGTRVEGRATLTLRAVDRVVVAPPSATHRIGTAGVRFTAQLLDAAGRPVLDATIRPTWTTADSSIATAAATADGAALATGLRAGRTDVVATAQGVSGRATLEVTGNLVTPTIAVSPADLPLEVGQSGTVTATVANVAAPATVEWVSRNPAVAAITPNDASAAVRGVSVGTTYVVATYGGGTAAVRDSARVRVVAAPSRVRFMLLEPRSAEITAPASVEYRVSLFDSAGTRIPVEGGAAVRYASSSAGVATVDATTGRATGVAGGTTTIRARYLLNGQEIVSDTAALLVYPPTAGHLGSVEISTGGNARELRVGQELLFQVLVRDVNGNPVTTNVSGLAVGPVSSPFVDVVPAPELAHGIFYRIRAKAPTPSPAAGNPLAAAVLIRADVTGAGATLPIVVRP